METLKIINRLTALLPNDDGGGAGGVGCVSAMVRDSRILIVDC